MSKKIRDFINQVADLYPEVTSAADLTDQVQSGRYFWICNLAAASGLDVPEELSDWMAAERI